MIEPDEMERRLEWGVPLAFVVAIFLALVVPFVWAAGWRSELVGYAGAVLGVLALAGALPMVLRPMLRRRDLAREANRLRWMAKKEGWILHDAAWETVPNGSSSTRVWDVSYTDKDGLLHDVRFVWTEVGFRPLEDRVFVGENDADGADAPRSPGASWDL